MFIKVGDDFADGDFCILGKYLDLLDGEISKINNRIGESRDPESDGVLDYGEYLIGQGFVAIQQYINSTYGLTGVEKSEALDIKPYISANLTLVSVLNAGANYWKHLEEWGLREIVVRDCNSLKGNAAKTIRIIEKVTPWDDYTCANLLAEILNGGELRLSSLLPKLCEWRKNLWVYVDKKT